MAKHPLKLAKDLTAWIFTWIISFIPLEFGSLRCLTDAYLPCIAVLIYHASLVELHMNVRGGNHNFVIVFI